MSSPFLITFSLATIVTLLLFLLIKRQKKAIQASSSRLPPGPRKLPVIGNLHQLAFNNDLPHRTLQSLSDHYGSLMFLQLGSVPTLVISSAGFAREIFKTHDIIFSGRPMLYAANKFSYSCSAISFAPYGEYWREVRKIAMLELLSTKRVQLFQAVREEEMSLMLENVAKITGPVNLSELTLLLSNNVICRVAFGKTYSTSRFQDLLRETQDLLGGFCIADFFPGLEWITKFNGLAKKIEKNFRELDQLYEKVLKEHLDEDRPKNEDKDLVDVLLQIQKDPDQAIALSTEQIKGIITDMFIAGTDTSAATLVWTMTELIRNPSVMRRAQDEVRGIVKTKEKVTEKDLSKLRYLKFVIKEALRLHPPAPLLLPRETTQSCIVEGYHIPAKTRVFINAKAIAMDPKTWENPDEFKPERFVNSSIDFRGQNLELIPFGVGRRICPGMNFSMQLVELVLANLLHCFDWELPHGMRREDLNMEEAFGITMHKKTALFLAATLA